MIEFHNVHKVYRRGQREVAALGGLSLTIEKGEFVAVMGPSGSGKSTFLHLAGGLDVPTSGTVRINGQDTGAMGDEALTLLRRRAIGLVFQFFNLIPTLTVLENTALPALVAGGRTGQAYPAAETLLRRVGLKDRMSHLPEELSGGEMQRVAIARALINDPPLLLADEPTGNLDSVTGGEIIALLKELHQGRTLIMVTHDAEMATVADRTVLLRDGRLEAGGR